MTNNQVEDLFVLGMEELIRAGLEFDDVARATLRDVLGESSVEVLFLTFGNLAENPLKFTQKLSIIFPKATVGIILDLVAKRARATIASPRVLKDSKYDALMRKLGELPGIKPQERKQALLHDHRVKDELDELVGHKTD